MPSLKEFVTRPIDFATWIKKEHYKDLPRLHKIHDCSQASMREVINPYNLEFFEGVFARLKTRSGVEVVRHTDGIPGIYTLEQELLLSGPTHHIFARKELHDYIPDEKDRDPFEIKKAIEICGMYSDSRRFIPPSNCTFRVEQYLGVNGQDGIVFLATKGDAPANITIYIGYYPALDGEISEVLGSIR